MFDGAPGEAVKPPQSEPVSDSLMPPLPWPSLFHDRPRQLLDLHLKFAYGLSSFLYSLWMHVAPYINL
ncbi:hypothetical protein NDU88_010339 [Pleurodeles waltl]|uniref:Uncharacterized protein n=1 Tax=Pleurodeles waltl TaxID=8319 RepID=A0AAV7QX42_PLEWA|nr:hypothetical protein NDU88_010339 [Pleurodeles waltl]